MLKNLDKRGKIIVMLAVMSGLFLVALDQTIISTALGAIVSEFHDYSSLGFIVTAYMLTTTVTVPIAGKMSDMYGRRPMLIAGISIFTIGSLLSGLAPGVGWLIAWRALQGIGGGIITSQAFTIVGDLFPPRERGRWQGIIGAVFGISSVIGPLLGGWLTDGHNFFGATTDWRWTFFVNVPIGIVATIIVWRNLPNIKHDTVHKPDYLGAALLSLSLAAIVLAVDNTETIFSSLIDNGVSLLAIQVGLWSIAALSGAWFIATERRAKQPVLPLAFFKSRVYAVLTIVALMFGSAFMGSILYLTQFNQQVYGASASEAGMMLLPMVGGLMTSSIVTGQIVSRIGRYKPFITAGLAIGALSILALVTLQPDTPYWHEAIIMVFTGIGLGAAMPILSIAVQNEFEQKDLGAATSSVQMFRGLGSTIGTALFSGMLTTGIIASIASPSSIPYIQTLQASAAQSSNAGAMKEVLGDDIDANSLLQVNSMSAEISNQADAAFAKMPNPAMQKVATEQFAAEQDAFHTDIVNAFTDSLHRIFVVAAGIMAVAVVLTLFVPNRKLKAGVKAAPSE
jgi:EmrB/QacA subfamily drug resistance transporter